MKAQVVGTQSLYTAVFRKNAGVWVTLCLENGLVGQGNSKGKALEKLQEAIVSFEEVCQVEPDVYTTPIAVEELHEFLTITENQPAMKSYELRAVYA